MTGGAGRPPRRRRRRSAVAVVAALLVAMTVVGYLGVRGVLRNFGGPMCRAVALDTDVTFDPEQTANAATISAVALKRRLPARAATIATATAIQESGLRNVTYGDRDSVGLFQQRPSQGWGTVEQILDPVYSAGKFYDALVKIDGYESMTITKVAQAVQRSAYPGAYADHEQEGRILASTLSGLSPGGLGCRLDDTDASTPPATVVAALRSELGVTATPGSRQVSVTARSGELAWATGAWAVAHAEKHGITSVTVGDRAWTRTRDSAGWSWRPARTPAASARTTVLTLA